MSVLDSLPEIKSFFGMDLNTGCLIIAALSVTHPTAYGCTLFMPISYLLVSVWILVAFFFIVSVLLFFGISNRNEFCYSLWIWYTLIFVVLMLSLMFLLIFLFTSKRQKGRVMVVVLGVVYYVLTIYFILVVNSHRKTLK